MIVLFACLFRLTPEEKNRIITIQQTKFFEDEDRSVTFQELMRDPDAYFTFNPEFVPANYNPLSAYWVQLDFCVEDDQRNYMLEFYDQTIDTIQVYLKHESDKDFRFYQFGDQFNFSERELKHKNFEITLKETGRYLVYYRVANRQYADMRVVIQSIEQFMSYALSEYYMYGIFYGMILIISLYNLLIYAAIREIKYVYYTFYILSVGLFAMCVDGMAYQLLWPNMPNWNQIAHGVAMFSLIFWSIIFSKKFLNLRNRAPRIDKILTWVLILRTLVFIYAILVDNRVFAWRNIELIPLSLIFIGSIQVLRRGYKPARFFVVAYGFLFLGFAIKALLMFSLLPLRLTDFSQTTQIISYYSLHICFLFEMLFLSVALSDRVRILKENKNRAFRRIVAQHDENLRFKDKINAKLEQRIAERTLELAQKNKLLELTNEQLTIQKREISEINSILDLDNYKLKNNLIHAQTDRLLQKSISYADFIQIFPDQDSALHFLAKHKWKESYTCRRCQNDKYLNSTTPYARRCTKCGYNETPTTETIFHAIKFPLSKAMYILYLHIHENFKSLNELSIEMELRKNTIWSFKKKITEYLSDHPASELDIFIDLQEISL